MVMFIENSRQHLLWLLMWGSLSAAGLAVGMLYWWMFFDTAVPIEVASARPLETTFPIGAPIVIDEQVVVHRHCPGVVNRYIVDGANIAYPILLPSDPLIGAATDRLRIEFQMPQHLGPGRYRYHAEAVWSCNPLRTIRQRIASVPFVVTPAQEAE